MYATKSLEELLVKWSQLSWNEKLLTFASASAFQTIGIVAVNADRMLECVLV